MATFNFEQTAEPVWTMTPMLLAISGPLKGLLFRLSNEEVTIGRCPSNLLYISDLPLSRRHCLIRCTGSQYAIQDLDSINGTFVNRARISEHVLADGDEIGIGSTTFRFVSQEPMDLIQLAVGVRDAAVAPTATIRLRKEDVDAATEEEAKPAGARSPLTRALTQMAAILTLTESMEAIEVQLLKLAGDVVPAEQGALVLTSSVRGKGSVFGWSRELGPCAAPRVSHTLIETVFRDRSSVLSSDLSASVLPGCETAGARVTSLIAAPLIARGKVQGVIYFDTTHASRHFGRDDLEFVTVLSSYMALAVDHNRRLRELESENSRLRAEAGIHHEMIGQSQAMQTVYDRIARIAPTDATVLIGGETGTGKELAARAIHHNSPRSNQPFEAINCALLNEAMLQSELFGHEKGAFTGAALHKKGKLEIADGGTVFLDEIGELPHPTQSMLLRVLQDRTFHRLGGTRMIQVNVRIIAATNKDLQEEIRKKAFREDLYYRLNVVPLAMPPLRERRDDIPLLARHFLRVAAGKNNRLVRDISTATIAILQSYDWRGNVRELENAIEHAVVFGSADEIEPEDLPEELLESAVDVREGAVLRYHDAVRESKKQIVREALQQVNGSYSEAAILLNIHVNNLHRLVRELNLKASMQPGKNSR